jgi:hypothetical protein
MEETQFRGTGKIITCCLCNKNHEELVGIEATKEKIYEEIYELPYEYTFCPNYPEYRQESEEQFQRNTKTYNEKVKELKDESENKKSKSK